MDATEGLLRDVIHNIRTSHRRLDKIESVITQVTENQRLLGEAQEVLAKGMEVLNSNILEIVNLLQPDEEEDNGTNV